MNTQGTEISWMHTWPVPMWLTVLMVLGILGWTVHFYLRERRGRSRAMTVLLLSLRLAVLGILVFMLFGWQMIRHRTDLPDVAIIVDVSSSMQQQDAPNSSRASTRLKKRLDTVNLADPNRLNLAKLLLLEKDQRWLNYLQGRYNVKFYTIAEQLTQSGEPGNTATVVNAWRPDGSASRLGDGLHATLDAQRGLPTAAIIYLTDGITTEGPTLSEAAAYARQKSIPIFFVALGSEVPPRDVRVHDLLTDEVSFVDDLLHLDFKVTANGYAGETLLIRLLDAANDELLATTTLQLGPDGEAQPVRISHRTQREGELRLLVEAQMLDGEANPINNQQMATVDVRDETIRVLYVQETPSLEFRFLKSLLERVRNPDTGRRTIELTTVLQEADLEYSQTDDTAQRVFPVSREELDAYDVILFGDTNPTYLSRVVMENLVAFVEERGGGVVFLAGPKNLPTAYAGTPLARLLPFDIETVRLPTEAELEQDVAVEPTRLAMSTPFMQLSQTPEDSIAIWRKLPGIRWYLDVDFLVPGAQVLLDAPSRTDSTLRSPVVTSQYVGAGKVITHLTDESYRWARYGGRDLYYARYWLQALRDLSRAKLANQSSGVELELDREEYYQGESPKVRVRFIDERLAPASERGVTVMVEQQDGVRRPIELLRGRAKRGLFEGELGQLEQGNYRVWIAAPVLNGNPPSQSFRVVPPPGELARVQMDLVELRRAAQVSRGRWFRFQDADQLLRELPRGRQVRVESLPPQSIWNWPWLVLALLLLVITEWILRKAIGMI